MSWIWFVVDFAISGFLVLAAIRMAYLGVYVTLHPPTETEKNKIKMKFVFWGIVAVCLTLAQTVRNEVSQSELTNTLKGLQSEAYIYLTKQSLTHFEVGKPITVNKTCKNSGQGIASGVNCLDALEVVNAEPLGLHGEPMVAKDVANLAYERFNKALANQPKEEGSTLGPTEEKFGTLEGPTLDNDLDKDIRNGRRALLLASKYIWKDANSPWCNPALLRGGIYI